MDEKRTVNYCNRRYYRRKFQNYNNDPIYYNKSNEFSKLNWYMPSFTDVPHITNRCIVSKEKFYDDVISSLPKREENGLSSLKERIAILFNNRNFSDIVLNINERKFFGHRFILSLASSVFKAAFYGEFDSNQKESFDVLDVSENGFENLLRFIYTDNIQCNNLSEYLETLYAARVFIVSSLVELCVQECFKFLKSDNLCQILDVAYRLDLEVLVNECLKLYTIQPEKVLISNSFLSAKTEIVLFLFHKAIENGTKQQFNFHLMKWALNEAKRRGLPAFEVAKVLKPFFNMNISCKSEKNISVT